MGRQGTDHVLERVRMGGHGVWGKRGRTGDQVLGRGCHEERVGLGGQTYHE